MNTEGHEAVVRLVNSQLVSTLPMEELLAGSVDPDRSKYGRYVGIESKHHYDDGSGSSGSPPMRVVTFNRLSTTDVLRLAGIGSQRIAEMQRSISA